VAERHRQLRATLAACLAAALLCLSTRAAANDEAALFERGAAALEAGEFALAIDAFEALADRGFAHPDASYDRGLAYVMRVRAGADRPGDLGRAAGGFEEALLLRPGDGDAQLALDLVRAEVTRRRSRRAKDAVDVRPTLDRALVGVASEQTWGLLAVTASVLFAVGLVLRRRPAGPAHVTGSVLWPSAFVALLAFVPLAWGARHLRLSTRPGVIVVGEAYLAEEPGGAARGDGIPEAALVETSERRGTLVRVRHGAVEGWIPSTSVRLLATR
jgi:hypothetical protein